MKKIIFALCAELCLVSLSVFAKSQETVVSESADDAIKSVYAYGFVDLEGAKTSAIIIEYDRPVLSSSIKKDSFQIEDFTTITESALGYDGAIEVDKDKIKGNEGQIKKIYVNDKAETAKKGKKSGNFVIIEVNTDYMLSSQNLIYTTSMIAGAKQAGTLKAADKSSIMPSADFVRNYTTSTSAGRNGKEQINYEADKSKIILPEFAEGSGWTLNYEGAGAFKATNCFSEYTGKYEDFELPYAIYVPDEKTMEVNKGNISLTIHMEHAAALGSDPMSALTSSIAAAKHASPLVQAKNPAIIVVPQVEESRRSTNDMDASSEANTAFWELLDYLLEKYKGYIDEERIYGTGQSMGGMSILYMASQRDNFFAGIAVAGAQWSNNYSKEKQGLFMRTPENDKISFNGFGLDAENFQNWYYMISDDNILVHTCKDDAMSKGEWQATSDYFAAAGVQIPYAEWDPYIGLKTQNENDIALTSHDSSTPGSGISWAGFTRGSHMSTWKYAYQMDYPFEWLYSQRRSSENARGKIEQLKNEWLGRDENGTILPGSGTAGLNSAQFTPDGAVKEYPEGWK